MYTSRNRWSDSTTYQDSGSEGTPLLSSGSHSSYDSVMFPNSETSDLDLNSDKESPRYGSISTASFSSIVTILPKRLPPLIQDSSLLLPSPVNMPRSLSFVQEKCYEIRNIDLIAETGKYERENKKPLTRKLAQGFLPIALSIQQNNTQIPYKEINSKQSSLVTIFSLWNTILGSSLITMPWGIAMAGLFPGIIILIIMSGLCLYTAHRILLVHKYHGTQEKIEIIQLSRILVNKWMEYIAKIFSIVALIGTTIAYWILMSNFLYNSVIFIYDNIMGIPMYNVTESQDYNTDVLCLKEKNTYNNTDPITGQEKTFDTLGPIWDLQKTVPIFLAIIIFPLLNFNTTTFFTKFNSLGILSIIYLVIFVITKSVSWGIHMDKIAWEISWILQPTFPALIGMLTLSFFIHNIIITIMQSNHDQTKNGRDLSIAYILVTVTYILVGVIYFMCFPLSKSCIEDNILNNFQKWDTSTVSARMVLLFQLLTVYPLLTYMLRIQVLSSICKSHARSWTIIVNLVIVSTCVLFAMFIPYVGTIVRYTGAFSGFIYVFTLPSLLHLIVLHKQNKMTAFSTIVHLIIPVVGALNLISQFFIPNH